VPPLAFAAFTGINKKLAITPPARPKARANNTRRRANPQLRARKPRTADLDFLGVLNGRRSSREKTLLFSQAVREELHALSRGHRRPEEQLGVLCTH
jgi:hypothetical protein